jgi:hypothetical protein
MTASRAFVTMLTTVALLGVTAACGAGDDGSVPAPALAPTESTAVSTTVTPTTTVPSTTAATTTLPGEPIDPIYAPAGAELGAVAIAFDETLDLRALPGSGEPVVLSLPPLTTGIVSTGRAQSLGVDDGWLEVDVSGTTGWAPLANLLHIGGTEDATARFVTLLGGTPTAPSLLELGRLIADEVASDDPEVTSRVVVAVAPTDGTTGEVTYDVVDLPDDSVGGARLTVTGRQVPTGSLPPTGFASPVEYELVSVDSTVLCYRGVTSEGLCI